MLVLLFLDQRTDVLLERSETYQRSIAFFSLLENVGVFEVVLQLSCALDTGIADTAFFR
jgi:hypothetical protein